MGESSGGIRVLHVDDNAEFADTAAALIEQTDEGITVETATSADEGLDRLSDADYDCVVSDYDMPGRDGIEFLAAVRDEYPDLPFILYTGKGSEEVASDAFAAGATDYLQKGRGADQYELLVNRVRNAVEQHRSARRADELDRVRTLVSDINQALIRSTTREEIETRVCEIISESDPYTFAWIGRVDLETERIEPQAWAGIEEGYLDEITIPTGENPPSRGPGWRAVNEGRVAVTQHVGEDPEFEAWREEAAERGYRAVAAIPLEYGDRRYGILAVYSDQPHAFDETERDLLSELGDDIAHALSSIDVRNRLREERDRRRALFDNAPVPVIAAEVKDGPENIRMTDVNDAFEEVFGLAAEDVVGRDPAETVVPEDGMEQHERFRERATAGERIITEVERVTAEGARTFLLQIVPYGVEDGQANGLYAWFTDITRQVDGNAGQVDENPTTDEEPE